MDSGADRATLRVWTFADGEGRDHLALPLYDLILRGVTYSVALSSGTGLVVLQHRGEERSAVQDAALVEELSTHIRKLQGEPQEPVVQFRAHGPEGNEHSYYATGVVAQGGEPFVVAQDEHGTEFVFRPPEKAGEAPRLVTDTAASESALQVARAHRAAESPGDEAAVSTFTLRLPDGETRTLRPERRVESDGQVYWIASDIDDAQRVYSLRQDEGGEWAPVTELHEIEAIRVALLRDG